MMNPVSSVFASLGFNFVQEILLNIDPEKRVRGPLEPGDSMNGK